MNYLNNKELREEIIKCKELDELTPKAIDMFILLSEKVADNYTYKDPEDKKDCVASALMDCYRYWRSYDPDKTKNAFAYFSSVCFNGLRKGFRSLGLLSLPMSKRISISNNKIYNF